MRLPELVPYVVAVVSLPELVPYVVAVVSQMNIKLLPKWIPGEFLYLQTFHLVEIKDPAGGLKLEKKSPVWMIEKSV